MTLPLRFAAAVLLIASFSAMALAQQHNITPPETAFETSFAIFVDAQTAGSASEGLAAYREALQTHDRLNVYTVTGNWTRPDELRDLIQSMAADDPGLEGFVLVGDIPIAMIRDAQHLTSSFKMDQDRFDFHRSSVPSDRFYDDFGLEFRYLSSDEERPLQHYYSLEPHSRQYLQMSLYSGRMKPPAAGEEGRRMINAYLLRVAEQKAHPPELQHALFTTGHGYHSESLISWEGEITTLREQFPQLFLPGNSLTNLYHLKGPELKQDVLRRLQQPSLDFAVFHAHGTQELQLLTGIPRARNVQAHVDEIQRFLRVRLGRAERAGQSFEEIYAQYEEQFGIPQSWFDGYFDEEQRVQDSLYSANQDISVHDIKRIQTMPSMVMFDQCFNGDFSHTPYIAGSYVFGEGQTVAALAHSVSILQDNDSNKLIGLLPMGVRVGWLPYFKNHLETHIIGDPTFRYTPSVHAQNTLNRDLVTERENQLFWQELLGERDPNLRALAVEQLIRLRGVDFDYELQKLYEIDPAYIVRLHAIKGLASLRSERIHQVLPLAYKDPYEFIRRSSVSYMGDTGEPEYLDLIAEALVTDHSRRVRFNARRAIEKVNAPMAAESCRVVLAERGESALEHSSAFTEITLQGLDRTANQLEERMIPVILDQSREVAERRRTIRTFRLYRYQQAVEPLLELVDRDDDDMSLRIHAAEVLGWYKLSYQRPRIVESLAQTLDTLEEGSELYNEVLRSLNRVSQKPNHPFTL